MAPYDEMEMRQPLSKITPTMQQAHGLADFIEYFSRGHALDFGPMKDIVTA
jgi:ABC-type phosphate transport system ATPase subunit